jgi:trans-aconitate 2-methyltransferase
VQLNGMGAKTMGNVDWNPSQYERFREERRQPFFDLLALVRRYPDMHAVDLGCGTGELTRQLHERLGARETFGIDLSDAMLARCSGQVGEGLRFVKGDFTQFVPEPRYDLVFSNAALQWAPDHNHLLGRLTGALTERGQLAVQVPANYDHPSHTVAAAVAQEPPFRQPLDGYVRPSTVLRPEEYATLLDRLGYREQHVRLQVYAHHLSSRDQVVEWVKGTLLLDYEQRLSGELYGHFLARYRESLLPLLPDERPYVFTFKRILLWGQR